MLLEVFIFTCVYLFGTHGIQEVLQCQGEIKELNENLTHLQEEIVSLEYQLTSWRNDPFYKEKIARQELQMARPDETIYMIS